MKSFIRDFIPLLLFVFAQGILLGQTTLITPTSPISSFGSVNSPPGEDVTQIRDGNINTKFLDFNRADGMGFTIDIGTAHAATQLTMTTANDSRERDPQSFTISGSNDNITFTPIATVAIPCIATRFFSRDFNFTNTIAYQYYRIIYNNPCDSPLVANSIQVAETQLSYPVGNLSVSIDGACVGTNDEFTLQFDVDNGTGDYEIYATSAVPALGINIGDVLGTLTGAATTGTGLTILGSIPGDITPATTIDVNVRDANLAGDAPVANIRTVNLPECLLSTVPTLGQWGLITLALLLLNLSALVLIVKRNQHSNIISHRV